MTISETTVERGSENVFADLGHPDASGHIVKAELVTRFDSIIRRRGMTLAETGFRGIVESGVWGVCRLAAYLVV